MPQADNSRGGATRARKVKKKKPAPSVRPQTKTPAPPEPKAKPVRKAPKTTPRVYSRSDAAQREGATTGRRKNKTPHLNSRSDSAQRQGATSRYVGPSEKQRARLRKAKPIGDKAYTDSERASNDEFKRTSDEYFLARRAAAKARYDNATDAEKKRLFGNPRVDAKDPKKLAAFKRDDDRMAEINRRELRRAVDKELSGQGKVAKFASKVAEGVEGILKSGASGGSGNGGGSRFAAITPTPLRGRGGKLATRAAKDLVNAPAQAVPAAYVPVAGVVEAAQGRPERLKRYVEDVKQTDPIYNTIAAGVETVKGNKKAARSHIRKAGKSASEHPGFTALEVIGAKGTLGRGGGNVMRSGVVGKKVKAAASTKREPSVVPGTRVVKKREYSRDVSRKVVQVATEKRRIRKAEKTRKRAEAEHDPDTRAELRAKANRQDPRVASAGEVRRRVDERLSANEDVRRVRRTRVTNEARDVLKPARKSEQGVVSLVAQRITTASKSDLRKYRDELEHEYTALDASGKRANRQLRKAIGDVLDDPKADLSRVQAVADRYTELVAPKQAKLVERGMLAEGREAKAKLVPYAIRRMDARHDPKVGLVDAEGAPLTAETIRAHMKATGTPEPAYVTQAPNQRGGRNFNIRSERAQTISSKRRTGEATRKGTFDADPETLVEGVARAQGLEDATEGFRGIVDEFAVRKQSGKVHGFTNKSLADRAAANLEAETGQRYRPILLNPFQARRAQLESLLNDVNAENQFTSAGGKSPIVEAIEDALAGKGEGTWGLIPEEAAGRIQAHLGQMNPDALHKSLQAVNSAFRRNVLSLSTTWAFGNVAEATLRAGLAKAGPRSFIRGRRLLKNLEKTDLAAAEELAVRAVGGGHYSSASRFHMNRQAEQFRGSSMEGFANSLGKFWRSPGPKQASQAWHWYTSHAFELMSRVESGFQTAMLGRAVKNIADPDVSRLAAKAADQAAAGKIDTNTMVALGRSVDRMYGRYGKRSPSERYLIDHYTPFIAWYINAVNFIVRTLPMEHPTTVAVIAQAELATEEWRKDHGLDKWMKGAVPGWLQGSIPVGSDGKLRLSRFLPFGLAAEPLDSAAGLVLPQFSAPLMAMKGMDWTGRSLGGFGAEAGDDEKAKAAAVAFATGFIPALSLGLRLADQGPAALNPLKVTKPPEPKKTTKVRKRTTSLDVLRRGSSSGSGGSTGTWGGSSSSGGPSGAGWGG